MYKFLCGIIIFLIIFLIVNMYKENFIKNKKINELKKYKKKWVDYFSPEKFELIKKKPKLLFNEAQINEIQKRIYKKENPPPPKKKIDKGVKETFLEKLVSKYGKGCAIYFAAVQGITATLQISTKKLEWWWGDNSSINYQNGVSDNGSLINAVCTGDLSKPLICTLELVDRYHMKIFCKIGERKFGLTSPNMDKPWGDRLVMDKTQYEVNCWWGPPKDALLIRMEETGMKERNGNPTYKFETKIFEKRSALQWNGQVDHKTGLGNLKWDRGSHSAFASGGDPIFFRLPTNLFDPRPRKFIARIRNNSGYVNVFNGKPVETRLKYKGWVLMDNINKDIREKPKEKPKEKEIIKMTKKVMGNIKENFGDIRMMSKKRINCKNVLKKNNKLRNNKK